MIYLEDDNLLRELPKPIIEATEAFRQILKHWNLYLKLYQTYPDGGSISLVQIGISSEPFTPKYKPAEMLHSRSTAEDLYQIWIETKKIDATNIWVYHSSEKLFIYSHSKQPTKKIHEILYLKWVNTLKRNNTAVNKETKKLFCEKMQKDKLHKCPYCQKKETIEEIRMKLQAGRIQL